MTFLLCTHPTAPRNGVSAPAYGAVWTAEQFMARGVISAPKTAGTLRNGADAAESHALGARSLR